jgi:formamidopyrimidine-DNA glycosylase
MPELPAMENFRRSIKKEALHRKINDVTVKRDRVVRVDEKELAGMLTGKSFEEVLRHGKHIFLRAGKAKKSVWLAFHCGMTGFFTFPDRDDKALTKAKLAVRFKDNGAMAFFDPRMFGRVNLTESPEQFIEEHHLGIDASAVTAADFAGFLAASKKPLKTFFLDQSIIAGIGNVYGDEIPFQAKISPLRKANSLSKAEVARLYGAMTSVLKTAIAKKAYLDHWNMLPKSWLVHYREEGGACPRCGGTVKAYKAGGRDGYYCPSCQL